MRIQAQLQVHLHIHAYACGTANVRCRKCTCTWTVQMKQILICMHVTPYRYRFDAYRGFRSRSSQGRRARKLEPRPCVCRSCACSWHGPAAGPVAAGALSLSFALSMTDCMQTHAHQMTGIVISHVCLLYVATCTCCDMHVPMRVLFSKRRPIYI